MIIHPNVIDWLITDLFIYKVCFSDDVNTNLTDVYVVLKQMSQKLDKTVQDLEETKQKLVETEKELNATKTRQLEAEIGMNNTRELLMIGK